MSDSLKTRREFLQTSTLGASAACTVPMFLERTFAQLDKEAKDSAIQTETGKDSRILVVLQLAGGNDGLNTVVPYADDAYYKARPRLRKDVKDLRKINDHLALSGNLGFMGSLYDEGELAIVQGVGYPNPNRSHFVSTSIWETADTRNRSSTGWLGRYFDHECAGADPTVGISLKKTQPESFGAMKNPGISLSTPELYRWIHGGGEKALAEEFFAELNSPDDATGSSLEEVGKPGRKAGENNLAFLERVAMDARVSSDRILGLASKYKSKVQYAGTPVSRSLNLVSRMIAGGMPTRVYYVSHGGFDTHQGQANRHGQLLSQLDQALKSFFTDLAQQGNKDRVTLLTFTEFGRRVAENASGGTDHGKGNCLFVAGAPVKGGLYGKHPSLTDLDKGDLKFDIDFRSIYATVIEDWMKGKAKPILNEDFKKVGFMG
ncbi:MAG: DUF1501 domain-containing protein [Roseibacillus sp.]|nr:DUF1501 domain-containing protein [Roseibacillus sp.]